MNPFTIGFAALAISFTATGADLSDSLKTIRAVGPEGKGNAAAAQAWQSLAQVKPAALPQILAAMDGANPLAANWLRAAVDTIASRAKDLPQMELMNGKILVVIEISRSIIFFFY